MIKTIPHRSEVLREQQDLETAQESTQIELVANVIVDVINKARAAGYVAGGPVFQGTIQFFASVAPKLESMFADRGWNLQCTSNASARGPRHVIFLS